MSKTIEISDETFERIKDQLLAEEVQSLSDLDELIGKKLYLRSVTYHMLGEVIGRNGMILQLKNASWIADSGRFMQCIKKGELKEVEPVGDCWVNLNTVTDFYVWVHKLPKDQI